MNYKTVTTETPPNALHGCTLSCLDPKTESGLRFQRTSTTLFFCAVILFTQCVLTISYLSTFGYPSRIFRTGMFWVLANLLVCLMNAILALYFRRSLPKTAYVFYSRSVLVSVELLASLPADMTAQEFGESVLMQISSRTNSQGTLPPTVILKRGSLT